MSHDSAAGDEFSFYGTAFPDLEVNQNAPKRAELDLTVRDERGRRRFHGAFTGGFSAGYFNSVGTKEGWAPSQFVSKKSERIKGFKRKPEDFMDDEDFGDHGIAPRQVRTNEQFGATESFAGLRASNDDNASVSDVLKEMIRPCQLTIGMRLYRVMKHRLRNKADDQVNTHVNLFEQADHEDRQSHKGKIRHEPKTNFHGIGYKSLNVSAHLHTGSNAESKELTPFTAVLKDGKKLKISGEAFGYGALEDEDADDEYANVYTFDDLSKYDYALGSGGKGKTNLAGKKTSQINFTSTIFGDASLYDYFVKDRPIVFERDRTRLEIPRHWRPKPPFARKRVSRFTPKVKETVAEERKVLNANARSLILGETPTFVAEPAIDQQTKAAENANFPREVNPNLKVGTQVKPPLLKSRLVGFFANKFIQGSEAPTGQEKFNEGLTQLEHLPKLCRLVQG